MRILLAFLVAAAVGIGAVVPSISYAGESEGDGSGSSVEVTQTQTTDDENTVDVQLVVFAVVGGIVFILLPLAYLLRRRLGLTAYTPPAEGHH